MECQWLSRVHQLPRLLHLNELTTRIQSTAWRKHETYRKHEGKSFVEWQKEWRWSRKDHAECTLWIIDTLVDSRPQSSIVGNRLADL
jgi:hypothetical protein